MRAWLNANDVTAVNSKMGGIDDGANHLGLGLGVDMLSTLLLSEVDRIVVRRSEGLARC